MGKWRTGLLAGYLFLILAVVAVIGGLFFALTWNAKDGYERAREI